MDKKFVLRTSRGREYAIVNMTSIGRNADCMIRINHPVVSGHHASVWVVQDRLWLSDNNSTNGVFVNGERIPAGQGYPLYNGDRIHLGDSPIEIEVFGGPSRSVTASPTPASRPAVTQPPQTATRPPQTAPQPARRLAPIACLTMLGCLAVVIVGGLFSYFFLGTSVTALLPGQTRVLAVSTPQPLLKAQEYAASGQKLAEAVAQLNQSELAFIKAVKGESAAVPKLSLIRFTIPLSTNNAPDDQLRQIAADAFRVAKLADSLSQTMAAQDGGSQQAGQMATQYKSVANMGAALVIEVQDLRKGLAGGTTTQEAAASLVAEYGARLWNPAVKDLATPSNPFTPYLSNPSTIPVAQLLSESSATQLATQLGSDLSSWVAASAEEVTKKYIIPNFGLLEDAALVADLLTPDGQADGDAAKKAAAAILKPGSTNPSDTQGENQLTATFASAITVGAPDQPATTPSRNVMSFPTGPVTIINSPAKDDTIASLVSLDGANPAIIAEVPVKATQPLVNLEISNINITTTNKRSKDVFSTFEADVVYEFDVKWTTNLGKPQFDLDCVSGNHFAISTASGSQRIKAKGLLLLYPGSETAYCYASQNNNTWGSATVSFLVGDAAEATQRADKVETDSVSLNLTLTSEALGTLAAENAKVAATLTSQAIEDAVSTEVYGTRTAEFIATITEIARQTKNAPTPVDTETPLPTATFTPVLVETFFHPGDVHTVVSKLALKPGRLYRICLSGAVYITTGVVYPSDIDYVNGIKVPLSGCVVIEGNGAVARISCSKGEPAEEPGGFTVQVYDLGPID